MQENSLDEQLFDQWNEEKKNLNKQERIVHPKSREIWYIKIGVNVGREILGKKGFFRPVLVISKLGNMYFCIPMTTKAKQSAYYIKIISFYSKKDSYLVINQGRVFDSQRFFAKKGKINLLEFEQIKKLLKNFYFPEVFFEPIEL